MKQVQKPIYLMTKELQDHLAKYGYDYIDIPIIEQADLFLTKAGDQVAKRLFTFERYGKTLALRPEFTAAAAHLYNTYSKQDVVRWQYSGPIFEDIPADNNFQRHSVGAELIGMDGPVADAEVVNMAIQGLNTQGIEDWFVVIGHVGLTRQLLSNFALDSRTQRFILSHRHLLKQDNGKAAILHQLDQYLPHKQMDFESSIDDVGDTHRMLDTLLDTSQRGETMGGRSKDDIVRRLQQKRKQMSQRSKIEAALDFLQLWLNIKGNVQEAFAVVEEFVGDDDVAWQIYLDLQLMFELLSVYQIPIDRIILQPDLARSWDYYTGMVFEIFAHDGVQLVGGGRYNELTQLIGGRAVPAVGLAYFVDRLQQVVPHEKQQLMPRIGIAIGKNTSSVGIEWAQALRQRGVSVFVVHTYSRNGNQLVATAQEDGSLQFNSQKFVMEQLDLLMITLTGLGTHAE